MVDIIGPTARLEDILRICLQRPMQRVFMQVVCRRSMVSWQFLRFLVARKEHRDAPFGESQLGYWDANVHRFLTFILDAYKCLRRGGTGDPMDAWHRFIYNVPLHHWAGRICSQAFTR